VKDRLQNLQFNFLLYKYTLFGDFIFWQITFELITKANVFLTLY